MNIIASTSNTYLYCAMDSTPQDFFQILLSETFAPAKSNIIFKNSRTLQIYQVALSDDV